MAEVKWVKIVTDIFDNRKIKQIESLPEGDTIIVIWFKLLCLAGTINDNGNVYITQEIPYTDETLATQFNRPLKVIQLALHTFQSFGMVEIIDDILRVSNWENYQNVAGLEKIREQNRLRKQKQRDREKQLLLDSHVMSRDSHAIDKNRIDKNRIEEIITIYEEEIGLLTPYQLEIIEHYLNDLSVEMIIEAIKRASKQNKKNLSYIEGILKNWVRCGYKTTADIKDIRKDNKVQVPINTDMNLEDLYYN